MERSYLITLSLNNTMPEFINNSVVYGFVRRVFTGSRAVKLAGYAGTRLVELLGSLAGAGARVADGSRFVGLLKVPDYLDIDPAPVKMLYRGSRGLQAVKAFMLRALEPAGRVWNKLFHQEGESPEVGASSLLVRDHPAVRMRAAFSGRESVFLGTLDRGYQLLKRGFPRKSMLVLLLVFLAGFYAARQFVGWLVPGWPSLAPWSSGLCLGLLLILVLFQLRDRSDGQDLEAESSRGLVQCLWMALCRFSGRVMLLARHFKVVFRKVVFGQGPPVEGGDV